MIIDICFLGLKQGELAILLTMLSLKEDTRGYKKREQVQAKQGYMIIYDNILTVSKKKVVLFNLVINCLTNGTREAQLLRI